MTRSFLRYTSILLALSSFMAFAETASDQYYRVIRNNELVGLRTLLQNKTESTADQHGDTPLFYAAAFGSIESMKILLDAGANPNSQNEFGATPLMWCASDVAKVRLLVGKGADVNASSKLKRGPLQLAASHDGASESVRVLLEKGAKVSVRDARGITPLLAAVAADDKRSVALLIAAGADPNAKDGLGHTALMSAATNGNIELVELLLAKGADANAVSAPESDGAVKNGPIALGSFTALLLASANSGPQTVKALLAAGAKVDAQDVRGMTPLMLAIATDHADLEVIKLLLTAGASTTLKDKGGESALDWARKMKVPAILHAVGIEERAVGEARVQPVASTLPLREPGKSVAIALALLQRSSTEFMKQGGCVACHAQNITGVAVSAARTLGILVDESAHTEQLKANQLRWVSAQQGLLQRMDPPVPEILEFSLLQMDAADVPADRSTDAMIVNLAAQQSQAGNWHIGGIARPPWDGDFSRTAFAVKLMERYGPPGREQEYRERIGRAAKWLAAHKPVSTDEQSGQLLGLAWAGVPKSEWQPALDRLVADQRADGGWAQTRWLASDAYATGQVLNVLHELGVSKSSPAYRLGVEYLLRTQRPDGAWLVKSRAPKFQPYFDAGFPQGPDQWISHWATGYATLAILNGMNGPAVAHAGL